MWLSATWPWLDSLSHNCHMLQSKGMNVRIKIKKQNVTWEILIQSWILDVEKTNTSCVLMAIFWEIIILQWKKLGIVLKRYYGQFIFVANLPPGNCSKLFGCFFNNQGKKPSLLKNSTFIAVNVPNLVYLQSVLCNCLHLKYLLVYNKPSNHSSKETQDKAGWKDLSNP